MSVVKILSEYLTKEDKSKYASLQPAIEKATAIALAHKSKVLVVLQRKQRDDHPAIGKDITVAVIRGNKFFPDGRPRDFTN
ncbi:hypothetical protein CMI41_04925 [Candidatus Pacearchaeota archaeon]|nr:hypothetical protein [Candidatus Pacearchaeota archaeon]|tara:strand:+ start:4089 stop:4331 length:243 start_codon:yes stop_codon:yes gene_type:complete